MILAIGLGVGAIPLRNLHAAEEPREKQKLESFSSYEEYPESKFGYSPARGTSRIVTEAEKLDSEERLSSEGVDGRRGARRASRSIASMHPTESATDAGANYQNPTDRKRVEFANDADALAARRKGIQEVAIIAGDLGFFPKTIFVTRDIPVRLFVTGASKAPLCLMMDSFQVRKQIRTQKVEEISFTPNQPGQYRFYCPVNGMEGTLIVKELAS